MRLTLDKRRKLMARFRSTNTRSEVALRKALVAAGIGGYRVNVRSLPGRPDLAFTRWKVAVFVDGEFWHGHPSVFRFGTKGPYWDGKIARNQARDTASSRALTDAGWFVIRLWSRDVERDPNAAAAAVNRALVTAGRPPHEGVGQDIFLLMGGDG